ncbi:MULTISPECIES: hypothetical protein [unclassified Rhizobium]|uniref:hypothetical protein n=1 Tax=Rhizobium sp. BG4 TaxID=2613770 RepID=UPI00193E49CE|nr:hypothetical protein [Rhizobium sp. BG4]QRM42120.1 hypothetical protein F2982_01040 [Rhizobium sp. BG4]
MNKLVIFLCGGFGGIAPSLVDFARTLLEGSLTTWIASHGEALFSLAAGAAGAFIFFIIGGIVVLSIKEQDGWKAILIGIAAPSLIISAKSGNVDGIPKVTTPTVVSMLFTPAIAQEALPNSLELQIKPAWTGTVCGDCEIKFYSKNGELLKSQPIGPQDGTPSVPVPNNTKEVWISGGATNPAVVDLQKVAPDANNGTVTLDVARDRNYANDFWRGFGNRSIQPYDFSVGVQK